MTDKTRELQIDEDMAFQRREWRAQHVGWWLLALFVLAALAGLFGTGPLSASQAGTPGAPVWVDYDRFIRRGAVTRISVHLTAADDESGSQELRINRSYFDSVRIQQVTPSPGGMHVGERDVVLRFDTGGAGPSTIVIDLEPLTAGSHAAALTAPGGTTVAFSQFAYF